MNPKGVTEREVATLDLQRMREVSQVLTPKEVADILYEILHYLKQGVYDFTVSASNVCITCKEQEGGDDGSK